MTGNWNKNWTGHWIVLKTCKSSQCAFGGHANERYSKNVILIIRLALSHLLLQHNKTRKSFLVYETNLLVETRKILLEEITERPSRKIYVFLRVTSLEQLSLAEFIGKLVRQKVDENGSKNVRGIWFDLEWQVKYSTILFIKAILLCQKSAKFF